MSNAKLKDTCRRGHPNIPENRRKTNKGTTCAICHKEAMVRRRQQWKKPRKDDSDSLRT